MLKIHEFPAKISQIKQPLWIAGDDEFLKLDACNLYIEFLKKSNYTAKHIALNCVSDWQNLHSYFASNAFFVEKTILICQVNLKSLNKNNDAYFSELIVNMPKHLKIIFISNKISATIKKTQTINFFTELTIWPMRNNELELWTKNTAMFYGINSSREQLQYLIKKADDEAATIKNSLKILHANSITTLDELALKFCIPDTNTANVWSIIDAALAGNCSKLKQLIANSDQSISGIMSLFNACLYMMKNIINIYDLSHDIGLNQACSSIINWPKQRAAYEKAMLRSRGFDWHIVMQATLKLEQELKGRKSPTPTLHKICNILFSVANHNFYKKLL